MSLRQLVTLKCKDTPENKEVKYVARTKSRFLQDGELPPSFWEYIKSYLLPPIIFTLILAIFRDGVLFILLMWVFFWAYHIYTYRTRYPSIRPATEDEIRIYTLSKKKELLDMANKYRNRLSYYDIYGMPKNLDEEYSKEMAFQIKHHEEYKTHWPQCYDHAKEKETNLRYEMEKSLNKAEEEYGPNWKEDFRKELIEHGFIRNK